MKRTMLAALLAAALALTPAAGQELPVEATEDGPVEMQPAQVPEEAVPAADVAPAEGAPVVEGEAPVAAGAAEDGFAVTVELVEGQCHKRLAEDEAWSALAVGDVLGELALVRTGFGSRAVLRFADNAVVEVGPATKMGIREFRRDADVTRTNVGIRYGTLSAEVDRERGPSDFTVDTPVATLAVTGTGGRIGVTADRGMTLIGTHGTWAVANGARMREVAGGERTNGQLARSGELLTQITKVQLGPQGLTPIELGNLLTNGGGRGVFGFNGSPNGGTAARVTLLANRTMPDFDSDGGTPLPYDPNILDQFGFDLDFGEYSLPYIFGLLDGFFDLADIPNRPDPFGGEGSEYDLGYEYGIDLAQQYLQQYLDYYPR